MLPALATSRPSEAAPERLAARRGAAALLLPWVAVGGLSLVARLQPLGNADVLWQIRTGEAVLQQGARLEVDLFSYPFRGRAIHDHEAAFEAVVAFVHRLGGMNALWWTTLLALVAAACLATEAARRLLPSVPARIVAGALIVAAIAARSEPRAEIATFAAIALAHWLRREAREMDGTHVGLLRRLSPMFVAALLAPFHGLCWWTAVVPLAHAAEGVLSRANRRAVWLDLGVAAGCVLLPEVTAPGSLALNVRALRGSAILQHISELRSPFDLLWSGSARLPFFSWFVGLLSLVGLWLVFRRARGGPVRGSDVLLLAALLLPGVRWARFAVLPLLAAMPWAIAGLAALAERALRQRVLAHGLPVVACALSVVIITESYGQTLAVRGFDFERQPVNAVEWLRAHRPNAQLFHPYNFGSYLIFARFPPRGVIIDPRAQTLYPDDYVARYYAATSDPAKFEAWAAEMPFDTVLIARDHKGSRQLREYLERSPAWHHAFTDRVAMVFVRKT